MNSSKRSDRIIAAVTTVVVHALIVVLLLAVCLTFPPEGEPLPTPPEEETDLLLGGEYVVMGNSPELTSDQEAAPANEEQLSSSENAPAEAAPQVSPKPEPARSEQPSKGTVPVKSTPTPEERAAAEAAAKRKAEEEAAKAEQQRRDKAAAQIRNSMKFNGKGSGEGKQGSPNGNSTTGATAGSPGHDLSGRTIESWDKPASTLSGTIRIRVKVNAKGQVVSASYDGGSGPASANATVRQNCVNASRHSRFSVRTDSQADQTGLITWRFQ